MNGETCSVCKKKMGNSLHKVWSFIVCHNIPVHKHCKNKLKEIELKQEVEDEKK